MIFSDRDIRRLLAERRILVEPAPDLAVQLGSCSLDLRLNGQFSLFRHSQFPVVDVRSPQQAQHMVDRVTVGADEPFFLQPRSFVLASTLEWVELPDDIVARLEGRSSLGRLGIIVHATASVIDPGWRGRITLELANHGIMPVALYYGMRICSLTFEPLTTPVDVPYWKKADAKYNAQHSSDPSRIADDADIGGS